MAVFKVKLVVYQGSTFRKHMTWRAAGVPVDLTGCTARMQIRPEVESPTVLASLTTENGGITLGGVAGTIDLYLSSAATTLFSWEEGAYDIEFIFTNGDVLRKIAGSVKVSPEVTR
jgi:hypothetical protein